MKKWVVQLLLKLITGYLFLFVGFFSLTKGLPIIGLIMFVCSGYYLISARKEIIKNEK